MTAPKHLPRVFAFVALAAAALAVPAFAADPTHEEPATVRSRNVEFNKKTGTAAYRGNVIYVQGDLSLDAARVDVTTRRKKADTVTASGNPVVARQRGADGAPAITIEAAQLDYDVSARTLDLRERVLVRQGEDTIRAASARYDLNTGRLDARADTAQGGRVEALIHRRPETPAP
jgi:lipopolysaccharide transport protein LptA